MEYPKKPQGEQRANPKVLELSADLVQLKTSIILLVVELHYC